MPRLIANMRTLIELSHNRGSTTFNVYLIDGTYELFRHCYALPSGCRFRKVRSH